MSDGLPVVVAGEGVKPHTRGRYYSGGGVSSGRGVSSGLTFVLAR